MRSRSTANRLRPDLVLLEFMMPRLDGFEVAQRLRKNPQTANTSIIMLTAKALRPTSDRLQSGADDYIIKPFDRIELLARVKGTLRRAKEMRNLSPLTGLPGNIRIQEEIERKVREGQQFAVLYADLDNFKAYHDPEGLRAGDRPDPVDRSHRQDSVVAHDGAHGSWDPWAATTSWSVVGPGDVAGRFAKSICDGFDAQGRFLRPDGPRRGFVRIEDRKGLMQTSRSS